ncbi:ABC transporter permease [Oscillatoria laete-virens NRMC-F 0139]|nr:ABC transporter permease [Oscillatoria laete-virens]MDL5052022.1 ABC transporter permease [Oscillatoria laete-virens NRMC-F 0139]
MKNLLNLLGDLNPQLFREAKGKLTFRQIALTLTCSLVVQLLFLLNYWGKLPSPFQTENPYCTGERAEYFDLHRLCVPDAFGNAIVDWSLWGTDVFLGASILGAIALSGIGAYWLIDDLGKEERRGTLNFIRLSPQSAQSIFLGKLLGVPLLLYLGIASALPLHFAMGLLAGNSLWQILAYDVACGACTFFIYSLALLFALMGGGFSKLTSMSGGVWAIALLWLPAAIPVGALYINVVKFFSPLTLLPYLVDRRYVGNIRFLGSQIGHHLHALQLWQWFHLPLGLTFLGTFGFILANALGGSWWIWQLLERGFRNPNMPLLSKKQSYGISACVALLFFGYFLQGHPYELISDRIQVMDETANIAVWLPDRLRSALSWYFAIALALIAVLSPHRQACLDWARYRHLSRQRNLWIDLIFHDQSPATVAIALNLAILITPLLAWVYFWPTDSDRRSALLATILMVSLACLCGAIAQICLLMRHPKREVWALGGVVAAIALPATSFTLLSISAISYPAFWLFTPYAWFSVDYVSPFMAILAAIAQGSVMGLLNLRLTHQLKRVLSAEC